MALFYHRSKIATFVLASFRSLWNIMSMNETKASIFCVRKTGRARACLHIVSTCLQEMYARFEMQHLCRLNGVWHMYGMSIRQIWCLWMNLLCLLGIINWKRSKACAMCTSMPGWLCITFLQVKVICSDPCVVFRPTWVCGIASSIRILRQFYACTFDANTWHQFWFR